MGNPVLTQTVTPNTATITVKQLIETITNATAGEFDFDNIPAGYDRLIIQGEIRGDVTADTDSIQAYFNADLTATNYFYQEVQGDSSAATASTSNAPYMARVSAASATTGIYSAITTIIENYTGVNLKAANTVFLAGVSTDGNVGQFLTQSSIAAAITRIRIRTDNHSTDQLFGTLTLYGEKEMEIAIP